MRRIVMFTQVSADGYFAASDGSLDWIVSDEESDRESVREFPTFDTVMLGRKTYELLASYWPKVLDASDRSLPAPAVRRGHAETRAIAAWLNDAAKIVYSRTLTGASWRNTRLVRDFDARAIAEMKRQTGKGILVFGSASIVRLLSVNKLIDEYRFLTNPVMLGTGRKLVDEGAVRMSLNTLGCSSHRSGHVLLRYAPGL
jgi:dihydrofolate reductase